jgi:hypothetical protein
MEPHESLWRGVWETDCSQGDDQDCFYHIDRPVDIATQREASTLDRAL